MRRLSIAILFLALTLSPSRASAQGTHPDYSGTFVLDLAQSEESPVVPPKLSYSVKQSATEIQATRIQAGPAGDNTTPLRFTLDGQPAVNQYPGPNGPMKVTTALSWEGTSLVFTSDTEIGTHQVDKWTLLEDGKKLRIDRNITANGQNLTARLTLVRQ